MKGILYIGYQIQRKRTMDSKIFQLHIMYARDNGLCPKQTHEDCERCRGKKNAKKFYCSLLISISGQPVGRSED